MPMVAAEPEYKTIEKVEDGPFSELAASGESPLTQARQLSVPGLRQQHVKAAGKVGFVCLACAVVAAVWIHSSRKGVPTSATPTAVDDVEEEFTIKSFPQDCGNYLRYQGCEKEKWRCDKQYAPSLGYRCCCETNIWHFPHFSKQQQGGSVSSGSISSGRGAVSVLRILQAPSHVCLAGPKDYGGHFTLEDCGNAGTRFKLPPRGAGTIELESQPGQCLSVVDGTMSKLDVQPCNHGSPQQMFQLTNGDKGMLQWSHGGNRCLDSETSKVEKMSKIVLADCVYWPQKPSQVFVMEDAPKKKPEKESKKDEDEEEDEKEEEIKVHPSLFCSSLMLPWSYEVDMMKAHLARKIGIFACTEWAVFSNEKVKLKEGATADEDVYNDIINGSLKAKTGGKYHTALNTPVFVRYWARLIEDGRPFKYDWTIKADPDSVFFPDRLTEMLVNSYTSKDGEKGVSDKPVWLNNCQLGLHGPIEVFNNHAFRIYAKDPSECDSVAEKHGQEDVFLKECFTKLQIPRRDAFNLLLEADWACNERPSSSTNAPPCYDRQVAFHPFKSVETYMTCWKKASPMTWNTPLYMNGNPPGPANQHHA